MNENTPVPYTHCPLAGYTVSIPPDRAQDEAIDFKTVLHAERSAALAAIEDLLQLDRATRQTRAELVQAALKLVRKAAPSLELGAAPEANHRNFLEYLKQHGGLNWSLSDLSTAERHPVYVFQHELVAYGHVARASLGDEPPFPVMRANA